VTRARRAGKAGDLFVRLVVTPHKTFERRGDDLFVALSVTLSQSALGDEIEVPTIEGKSVLLKVRPAPNRVKFSGCRVRASLNIRDFGRGNMYATIEVNVPKKLTKKQKELLEELPGKKAFN